MFNPFDEFPHAISIGHIEKVVDYPIAKERYVSERIINGYTYNVRTTKVSSNEPRVR